MKGAFEYACKIWEENLPPSLPITIRAEIGSIRGSGNLEALSKVSFKTMDYTEVGEGAAPTTRIKGVILKEFETRINHTFINYIENADFFENQSEPDIKIVYNKAKLNEFSYSIDSEPTDKYDFVTVVLRDIAKGLGFSSGIRVDPMTGNSLEFISGKGYTPFENAIWKEVGSDDLQNSLLKATTGALTIYKEDNPPLQLYAPEKWINGISLNAFIPNEKYRISQVLDSDFGKGCIVRNLSDDMMGNIFRKVLGWEDAILVGAGSTMSTTEGTTDSKMPYNGQLSFGSFSSNALELTDVDIDEEYRSNVLLKEARNTIVDEVYDYCEPFHAFYQPDNRNLDIDGWTVSILKKDGTWDLVYKMLNPSPVLDMNMSDFEFHYPDSIYARTCDGYLRGRVTRSYESYGYYKIVRAYRSYFMVIDYLPQTIEMGMSDLNSMDSEQQSVISLSESNSHDVRIGLKNIEGLTRVVIERKKAGQRVPSRFEVSDFKKGYFTTSVENDIKTTFTAIGYNDNGSSRSVPLTVEPLMVNSVKNKISIVGGNLILSAASDEEDTIYYEIASLNVYNTQPLLSGYIEGDQKISISSLPTGIYVLTYRTVNGETKVHKFKK